MKLHLDGSSHTPLYLQLEAALRERLASGEWRSGQALPPERELAQQLGVSRITLRRALERLEDEGLLIRRQGSGTYVSQRVEQTLTALTGFSQDMAARGLKASSRWLQRGIFRATPEEALAFGLSPTAEVSRLERLRLTEGEPMALELAALPVRYLPDPQAVEDSLYAYLDLHGLRPVRALQRLRAVAALPRVAELLAIRPGDPVLYIERLTYLPDGSVLEFTRSHYRGDRYDFVAELKGGK